MLALLMALFVLAGVVAIFATTPAGRRLAARFGVAERVRGPAPSEDVEFLLTRCGGDPAEVARRIAAERDRGPALTEAEHYRRAIRRLLAEQKHEGREPDPGSRGTDQ